MLADELNGVGCLMREDTGQCVPLTVVQMLKQTRQRKLIECFLDSARVELFVPAVPLQEEVLRRAVPIQLGGREVPVTTAEDLILLKLVFHRPKDLQDIRGILWVQRGKLDLDYMRHWSARTHEANGQQEMDQLVAEYASE